eukprot:2261794-Amphidinium_carterae.1
MVSSYGHTFLGMPPLVDFPCNTLPQGKGESSKGIGRQDGCLLKAAGICIKRCVACTSFSAANHSQKTTRAPTVPPQPLAEK